MVAGAQTMGALGVIRSLGRAGYRVHAASTDTEAIGLKSRFASHRAVHPSAQDPSFESWVRGYIEANEIKMIIPGSQISVNWLAELSADQHLFPASRDDEIRRRSTKYGLFEHLMSGDERVRSNLPPTLLVDFDARPRPSLAELAELGEPLFVKCDRAFARPPGAPDVVLQFENAQRARGGLEEIAASYSKAVVQSFVPGVGVGVFFLRWDGKIRARFMHRRLHEMPHTGGASSLRESWWHQAIYEDAEAKLSHVDWQGVAMVEYRWNPETDAFYLMEMNLRFWGSLHLALYAGIDFPKYLAQCFFGDMPLPPWHYPKGLRCRNTIPFEFGYMISLWRDERVPLGRKLFAVLEALWLTLDPRVRNDLYFPGDRKLYWIRLARFLKTGT